MKNIKFVLVLVIYYLCCLSVSYSWAQSESASLPVKNQKKYPGYLDEEPLKVQPVLNKPLKKAQSQSVTNEPQGENASENPDNMPPQEVD